MEAGVILLVLGLGLLSGSALLAFSWAARSGQLDDLEAGARVIFDSAELEAFDGGEENFSRGGRGKHEVSKEEPLRELRMTSENDTEGRS